jgi:hypothetical protein
MDSWPLGAVRESATENAKNSSTAAWTERLRRSPSLRHNPLPQRQPLRRRQIERDPALACDSLQLACRRVGVAVAKAPGPMRISLPGDWPCTKCCVTSNRFSMTQSAWSTQCSFHLPTLREGGSASVACSALPPPSPGLSWTHQPDACPDRLALPAPTCPAHQGQLEGDWDSRPQGRPSHHTQPITVQ